MKRLIISFCLVAALSSFSVYGSLSVRTVGSDISAMLDDAIKSAEDGDMSSAQEKSNAIEELFVKSEDKLSLFLDHNIVNQLGADISQLYFLAEEETKNDFCAHCRSAKITVTHIVSGETPTFSNVL